jgi:bifunctional DNA primase/polymerase-like protein
MPASAPVPVMLIAALEYTRLDLALVPMRGKRPHFDVLKAFYGHDGTTHLQRGCRAAPEEIRRWLEIDPQLNLAVATGPLSNGLVVIDWDDRPPDILPAGPVVLTPSGGRHDWYRCDDPNLATYMHGDGELRADGALVVLPPSIGYRFAEGHGLDKSWPALPAEWQDGSRRIAEKRPKVRRSRHDWGGSIGVLAAWDERDDVKDALMRLLDLSEKFVPWWRGSDNGEPSAHPWKDNDGIWVVRDRGGAKHGTPDSLTLTELYAAKRIGTVPPRIAKREDRPERPDPSAWTRLDHAAWHLRMLIELTQHGLISPGIRPYPCDFPAAPPTLSPLTQTLYADLQEYAACMFAADRLQPLYFSLPFARRWSIDKAIRRASNYALNGARTEIIEADLVHVVKRRLTAGGGRPTPLLRPGPGPEPLKRKAP